MKPMFSCLVAAALVAGSVPAIARNEPKTNEAGEPLICKKYTEVGSLVRKRKQCQTKAEWERIVQSQQDGARRTMDQLTEKSGCTDAATC